MSEAKFIVGQWVTCNGGLFRIKQITEKWMHSDCGYSMLWAGVVPFLWQVGKTYKTTLGGVTAAVVTLSRDRVWVECKWSHASEHIYANAFLRGTGRLFGFEHCDDVPHLLPYLADEQSVAESATYSEFDDADECNPQTAVPLSVENKIAGIYCCDVVQHFNFNIGSAIASLWTCDVGTNVDEAMLSLKAAAWYVQREIERREKGAK